MPSLAGNTLLDLAQTVARDLGPFQTFTATSTDVSGTNTQVISTALKDSEGVLERYGGHYVYGVTGNTLGQQQRVLRNGFAGATGTLTTAAPFANTPATLARWELHGVMPRLDQDGLTGLRTCINTAISRLWIRYRYPFVAGDGQIIYDLGALWWAKRQRFIRLLDPDTSGLGRTVMPSRTWDVVQNGETWSLELSSAYPVGQTFYLVVEMPVNARLYLSGAWAMQASPVAGLALDADACLGDFNDVYQATLYEAYSTLAVQAGGQRKLYWASQATAQRAVVSAIKLYSMNDDGQSLGEGPENAPGSWSNVVGDHGFWSR